MKHDSARLISRPDTSKEGLGELEHRSTDSTRMETKEELIENNFERTEYPRHVGRY